jgi:hypothetical protein
MPVPLGKFGSEPQEPSSKRDMNRHSMHPQGQGQGLAPPINMGDGHGSALGLENMHLVDQQRQGMGMKAPTVGRQSWYAS